MASMYVYKDQIISTIVDFLFALITSQKSIKTK